MLDKLLSQHHVWRADLLPTKNTVLTKGNRLDRVDRNVTKVSDAVYELKMLMEKHLASAFKIRGGTFEVINLHYGLT